MNRYVIKNNQGKYLHIQYQLYEQNSFPLKINYSWVEENKCTILTYIEAYFLCAEMNEIDFCACEIINKSYYKNNLISEEEVLKLLDEGRKLEDKLKSMIVEMRVFSEEDLKFKCK